jgi:hypothetical protein
VMLDENNHSFFGCPVDQFLMVLEKLSRRF